MTAGLGASTLAAGIKLSLPVLFAALGGMFTHQVNVFNIALESLMLVSAFFATVGSYYTSNPWIGLLFGVLSSILIALLFALLTVDLHADPVVVGIAMNLASWGVTSILLELMFGVRGFLLDPRIKSFPIVRIPGLESIPFVGSSEWTESLAYLALATAYGLTFFIIQERGWIRSLGRIRRLPRPQSQSPWVSGWRLSSAVCLGFRHLPALSGLSCSCQQEKAISRCGSALRSGHAGLDNGEPIVWLCGGLH